MALADDDERGVASFAAREPHRLRAHVHVGRGRGRRAARAPVAFVISFLAPAVSSHAPDFPLVLWGSHDHHSELPRTSSAIVPFQKLRLDTNLNQTTLPFRLQDGSPRSGTSSASLGSPGSSAGSESPGSSSRKSATQQLASGFLGLETDSQARTAQMSQDFMNALRLGDLTQQDEPQLSVRLRGSRVELASASEEEQVDF